MLLTFLTFFWLLARIYLGKQLCDAVSSVLKEFMIHKSEMFFRFLLAFWTKETNKFAQ